MAWVDWIIVAILVVSIAWSASRGFFVTVFSLAGLFGGLVIASWNYQHFVPRLRTLLKSEAAAEAVSFIAIALLVMIGAGLLGRLLRLMFRSVGLGFVDRILGAMFGVLQGCLVVTVGLMAMAAFLPHQTWLDESRIAPYFLGWAHRSTILTPAGLGVRIGEGLKKFENAEPAWLSKKLNQRS